MFNSTSYKSNSDNILADIALYNLLHNTCNNQLGLLHGKMGVAIFYFYYARYSGVTSYETVATLIFEEICEEINLEIPWNFELGLCGIGFGVELLKKEGFIEQNTDDLLCEIDKRIVQFDVNRIEDYSLERGLRGVVAYARCRIDSKRENNCDYVPFDKEYKDILVEACSKAGINFASHEFDLHSVWKHLTEAYFSVYLGNEWQKGVSILSQNCNSMEKRHESESPLGDSSKGKKCLLIFSEICNGSTYGVGTFLNNVVKCFNLDEWDIHIITLSTDKEEMTLVNREGIIYIDCPSMTSMGLVSEFKNKKKYYWRILFSLCSYIDMDKTVYYHFNYCAHKELAKLIKENFKSRIYLTVHYTSWSMVLLGDCNKLERILISDTNGVETNIKDVFLFEKDFMQNYCDRVIAISSHSYRMLQTLYEVPLSKLVCIPHGFQDCYTKYSITEKASLRRKYGFKQKEKLVLFAGRLDEVKGIMRLIEAFAKIIERIPSARLIVAGTGSIQHCLELAYPYWSRITFTGFLPKERLRELYAISNVGVVPSIFEEFGYVAGEMMLGEVPVVVSNTSGLKEIVLDKRFGLFFEYGEDGKFDDLVDKITYLLSQRYSRNKRGRERILREYSFSTFTTALLKEFK